MTSKKLVLVLIYLFFVLFLCGSCSRTSQEKHILIIQSYESNFPGYNQMKKTLSDQLEKRNIKAEVYSFYLNCEKNPEKRQKLLLYEKLDKLTSWKPDIILVCDDPALNAMLICDHPSIKTTPIVFTGVNYPSVPFLRKYPNITGFHDKPDYKTNIELIKRLIGNCIVVRITENTLSDQIILEDMNKQIENVCKTNDIYSPERLRLSGKNGLSLPKDKKIKPDNMYISTLNGKSTRSLMKGMGENYYNKAYLATKRDYLTLSIGRFSSFPGFSVINETIGYNYGIVGGYVTTIKEQTSLAANRIADILSGMPIEQFPQITETGKKYIFDYKVMEEWDIDTKQIPTGSEFANLPFFVRYRPYLIALFMVLTFVLIILFIYQRILYKRENNRKKEAQESLKQEKEFLSFALESGNIYTFRYKDGLFMFDKEFYHYLGLPEEPISADSFQNAIHQDDQEDFRINRYKLDHGLTSRQITQRRYDFNKKGYQWWEFRYAQNTNARTSPYDHNSVEVTGLCLNIQQIKETEMSLMQALEKAKESDRMKSTFLANMSHEIRTPLNAIVGFSQLIGSDTDLDEQEKEEFINLINSNSDLLLKLINDILDLSRIESGHISFTYEDCNLSQLLEEVYQTHRLLMPEGIELRRKQPDNPAIIHIDRFRLTQVLTNFINNATKFTKQGHIEIKYEYSADNQSILLSVEDTGMGIPKDKIKEVFERFHKLDEFAKGTGLGLAISQSIIKTFNGTIHLESEVGKGSKFIITLPYSPT